MLTANEWSVEVLRLTSGGAVINVSVVHRIIADLAAMEALAIGGDGKTHWYWKDHAAACEKERDEIRHAYRDCVDGKRRAEKDLEQLTRNYDLINNPRIDLRDRLNRAEALLREALDKKDNSGV